MSEKLAALRAQGDEQFFAYMSRNATTDMSLTKLFKYVDGGCEGYFSSLPEPRVKTNPVVVSESDIMTRLREVVAMEKGIVSLVGAPGVGKTTKLPIVLHELTNEPVVVLVPNTAIAYMAGEGVRFHAADKKRATIITPVEEKHGNVDVVYMDVRSMVNNSIRQRVLRCGGTMIIDESQMDDPMIQAMNEFALQYAKVMRVLKLSGTCETVMDYSVPNVKVENREPAQEELKNKSVYQIVSNLEDVNIFVRRGYTPVNVVAELAAQAKVVDEISKPNFKVVGDTDAIVGLNMFPDIVVAPQFVEHLEMSESGFELVKRPIQPAVAVQAMRRLRKGGVFYIPNGFDPKVVVGKVKRSSLSMAFSKWIIDVIRQKPTDKRFSFIRPLEFAEILKTRSWDKALVQCYLGSGPPPAYSIDPGIDARMMVALPKKRAVGYEYHDVQSWHETVMKFPDCAERYLDCACKYRNWLTEKYLVERLATKHYGIKYTKNWAESMAHVKRVVGFILDLNPNLARFEYLDTANNRYVQSSSFVVIAME